MHQHNGKRILVQGGAPDPTSNRKLCPTTPKGNTFGGDPVLIRLGHQEAKTIYPTHAIMLNVDEVPEFTNVDSFECIDIFRCEPWCEPGWLAAQGIDWLTPTSVPPGRECKYHDSMDGLTEGEQYNARLGNPAAKDMRSNGDIDNWQASLYG